MSGSWDGLLLVDKPAGPTSHDIVSRVRAATGAPRVGHTGTIDPPASGLLLLVLGRATRLARFVPDAPKRYEGELVLGVTTTTDDLSGEVLSRHDGAKLEPSVVRDAAAAQVGAQLQVPPAVSARHVAGTRMYRLARRGIHVSAPPSEIVVEELELAPTSVPERWTFAMAVSAGTYVRAIVRDLGAALGCGAAVASLRRTSIGPLRVADALGLPANASAIRDAIRSRLVPIDAMPLAVPSCALDSAGDRVRFAAGSAVAAPVPLPEFQLAAVRDDAGRLLGVARSSRGILRPHVVLTPSS